MAPVIPDPKKIKSFKNAAAFETWMPCSLPSQVSPVNVLVALFRIQTVDPSDRFTFATAQ